MKARKTVKIIYFLLLLFSAVVTANAQTCVPNSTAAGSLDSCFGTEGKVLTQISQMRDQGNAIVVQPDGKILVAGIASQNPSSNTLADFAVVRYNTDGSLDTSFDGDGKVTTNFDDNSYDWARGIALQSDGKIVVVGYSEKNSRSDFAIARYNSNGSLDTTFDGDGRVLSDLGMGSIDRAYAVVIQADGKIVVAGEQHNTNGNLPIGAIVRYNTNGSPDTTFDPDGVATVGGVHIFYAVALQADGKIVGAGTNSKIVVARLNPNATLDTSFGTNGIADYSALNIYEAAFAMVIEKDGKIVAGGYARTQPSGGYFCAPMVRFNRVGSVEASSLNCNDAPGSTTINSMALQKDGKIVAAGYGWQTPWMGFLIMRYNHALSLDYSFNNGEGDVHVGFSGAQFQASTAATAAALQSDNKIVATGWKVENGFETTAPLAVSRVNAGIVAPHTPSTLFDFDGDGKSDVSVFRPSTNVWYGFQSSNAQVAEQEFGLSGDTPAPADYDGDGRTDLGVFRSSSGDWWFKSSITGVFNTAHWGQSGDIPRPSDFDGDGKADFVVFRPSTGVWYRLGTTGQISIKEFGLAGDKPLVGDFDDDGKSDLAIFRPSTGDWWWLSSNDNIQRATHWGISTDTPAPADYDGDGKTDFAVYRDGTWYILNSINQSFTTINFGLSGDKPVAADYDGDGKADIAVFRPSQGVWYLLRSTAGFSAQQFGVSTDIPTPNAFVP